MTIFKKLNLFLIAILLCFTPSLVSANLSVAPYNANRSDPQNKDWFIFSAKPGDVLSDSLILNNSDKEDYQVSVFGRDAQTTDEGSFTIISDQEENKNAGNWLKLDTNKVVVPARQSIKLPFKIEIPKNTKDGEYAAGFGITQINPNQEVLNIQIRKGLRAYIAVGQDFTLGSKIENLNILDPKDSNYLQSKLEKQYFGKDNMILEFDAQNLGNVFGVIDCKYALNYADGTVFESTFSTDLAPEIGKRKYDIITNQPYKIGKTQAILDCKINPQNIDSKNVKIENQNVVTSDSLILDDLNNFEISLNPAFKDIKSTQNINDAQSSTGLIPTNEIVATLEDFSDIYIATAFGLFYIFCLIIISLVYFNKVKII